jgi:Ribonuclease G/E
MGGHHRVKAATESASAAVDFVEAVCPEAGGNEETDFPFDAVTRQFGPMEGDSVRIDHGKPDGRAFSLGTGEVTRRDPDGTVVVEREMSGRGTYDALGIEQRAGDVAVTKLTEGKWWYPTVYRGAEGEKRGTYVNVCTPVEVFPRAVRYVDLHVDVVKHADGTVERVDDDELDAAVAAGHVPEALAEKARSVAGAVANAL